MFASIVTSAVAYVSTNIDDIFVITILLAQAAGSAKGRIAAGHFLGVGTLTAVSMLGAVGLRSLPLKYVGVLGLVPIILGIRAWKAPENDDAEPVGAGVLSVAMIALGNGADNIGVYIPLFTSFSGPERAAAVAVFAVMTALWLFLADTLAEFPGVKALIGRYKRIVIPVVFIALGIYIILDSGLLG